MTWLLLGKAEGRSGRAKYGLFVKGIAEQSATIAANQFRRKVASQESTAKTTALLEFGDLPKLNQNISREHTVIMCGDHVQELSFAAAVLRIRCVVC